MFNRFIAHILPWFPPKLIWIFSRRYIAGTKIEDGIRVSRELNEAGAAVTSDLLGEFITSMDEAVANRKEYLKIIDRYTSEGIEGNFSVKPTMFGLLIDEEACYQHIRAVVAKAASKGNFVRVDMEDSQCVDREITLYRRLKAEFPESVGLVVQAYMRRTLDDLKAMMDMHTPESPLNFRLCKGIYIEPESVAYKGYQEVRDNFLLLLRFMLENKIYVGIATHDKYLIDNSLKLVEELGADKGNYEFQMLHGVTPELRNSVVQKGHLMRVYVPFGEKWFGYSTRRLKENPKMASHIIKALFIRG